MKIEPINDLIMQVALIFSYMEQPHIPRAMAICRKKGWTIRHHDNIVLPVAPERRNLGRRASR